MKTKQKKFDAVKWVREIRNKFYKEHKNLRGSEYIKAIRKDLKKNSLSNTN
jgi:hypothetical protein